MARRVFQRALIASLLGLCAAGDSTAQDYPAKPITTIVPFAAGGPLDVTARILAAGMRKSFGQPLIIENTPGAGGSVGVRRVASAAPDGYTLGIGNWGTHVANGVMHSLPYDLIQDFAPVALLPSEPLVIAVSKAMPVNGVKDLIGWLKAHPDKATSGTSGIGGPSHVAALLFARLTGTKFRLVPYRGAGPAMQDLVAGQVNMMITAQSMALPHMRNGSIKVFAVAAKSRLASASDIPTVDESGLPDFYVASWSGLWAPKGTSPKIIATLNASVRQAFTDPNVRKRYADLGLELPAAGQQTPEALGAFQKAEIEKWWPVIKAAGIKVE